MQSTSGHRLQHALAKSRGRTAGAVLVETLAAAMIIGLFMGGLLQLNAFNARSVRAARETVAASLVLQERLDQIRNTTWSKVSDAAVVESMLNTPAASSAGLPQLAEQVTISAYAATAPTPAPAVVTRAANGTTTIVSSNPALSSQTTVRADVTITWRSSPTAKTRTRALSTIIAEGGITR